MGSWADDRRDNLRHEFIATTLTYLFGDDEKHRKQLDTAFPVTGFQGPADLSHNQTEGMDRELSVSPHALVPRVA